MSAKTMPKIKQKLTENLSRIRFNWWRYPSPRRYKILKCLCVMCHQNRKPKPGLTASDFDGWCDECFVDLPLWLKLEKTTTEELKQLAEKENQAANIRKQKREEKAKAIAAKAKKKVKLTGFENVEKDRPIEILEAEVTEKRENYDQQRQQLESIFHYESDD